MMATVGRFPGAALMRAGFAAMALTLAGCATMPDLPPVPPYDAAALQRMSYRAVLVAGDASIRAFDNAADRLAEDLALRGATVPGEVHRFSARTAKDRPPGVGLATVGNVLDRIAALRPASGEGCLVYATAHGVPEQGLYFPANPGDLFLTPERLDSALVLGCGNAPTVVVLSGCYAGSYLRAPLTRANRVILTAARKDRSSFGCGAASVFTEFDDCMITAMEEGRGTWGKAFFGASICVAGRERQLRVPPSEPQSWIGDAVAAMKLPWRAL